MAREQHPCISGGRHGHQAAAPSTSPSHTGLDSATQGCLLHPPTRPLQMRCTVSGTFSLTLLHPHLFHRMTYSSFSAQAKCCSGKLFLIFNLLALTAALPVRAHAGGQVYLNALKFTYCRTLFTRRSPENQRRTETSFLKFFFIHSALPGVTTISLPPNLQSATTKSYVA